MPDRFHPFSADHFGALGVGFSVLGLLLWFGTQSPRRRNLVAAVLAGICLLAWPMSQIAWMMHPAPKSLENILPLHLCDVAAIVAGFALLTRHPTLCALTYFWGLAATIQALLTPNVSMGFPHLPYLMFFTHHFAIVGAALFLPIVDGWKPKRPHFRAVLEVYLWSLGYLAVAMSVNRWLGTNFGFASRPPENPSLIDYLGPWPWYLVGMQALAIVFFQALTLPFRRINELVHR